MLSLEYPRFNEVNLQGKKSLTPPLLPLLLGDRDFDCGLRCHGFNAHHYARQPREEKITNEAVVWDKCMVLAAQALSYGKFFFVGFALSLCLYFPYIQAPVFQATFSYSRSVHDRKGFSSALPPTPLIFRLPSSWRSDPAFPPFYLPYVL